MATMITSGMHPESPYYMDFSQLSSSLDTSWETDVLLQNNIEGQTFTNLFVYTFFKLVYQYIDLYNIM